ncbi:Peptidyl serine alpha-galactosyltransferase [Hondaea fermentalgiana]|uniref:Peptidyl serine alpha-galactosyltransferase n=1 Tax=Hondaea fermentalgiana TaxID=2315210 RepID=A0A2R5G5D1_9STRA|nr:Peptidyl serine alpha-galactosyltransferase [Hondaea fermentalgiana]|eukprot:GBG26236.1 Peptidyl serine alpha-galactosyltransferase [Hondaea fermentalgiana]
MNELRTAAAGMMPHAASDTEASKYRLKGWRLRKTVAAWAGVLVLVVVGAFALYGSAYAGPSMNELNAAQAGVPPAQATRSGALRAPLTQEKTHANVFSTSDQAVNDAYPVGFARVPRLVHGPRHPDDGKLHIIFSSGCNYFQHWQSELLLATAKLVGQRGRITRIVSGCHDRSAETIQHRHQTFPAGKNDLLVPMLELNRSVNDEFGLYVTPSFEGARDFPWINKPSSIEYFMTHARPELDRLGETVVAILDPDFVFLRPLSQSETDPQDIIASRGQDTNPARNSPIDWVRRGRPVAQRYGLEGHWASYGRDSLLKIIGDANSPALSYTKSEAARDTSVGPPLMLHVDDLAVLSKLWAKYMLPVLERGKDILADMWAYSIASAHLGLRHTTLDHYMVSVHGKSGQGYTFVDEYSDLSCQNPLSTPGARLPVFIHMASNYKAPDPKVGPWMFHKGHVPADILDCKSPLIIQPPDDLWRITDNWKAKQNAWMLCHIIFNLNRVASLYKAKFCPQGFEDRQLIKLIQSKNRDRSCSQRNDKWCYPLAQIEGLPINWRSALRDGSA